ncbi:MAG: universal stress protein [Cyanobacteria bacterium J06638_22]
MPFSKLMIAVEKPPLALKVAETGFALANALNTEVILVHVNPSALLYAPDSGMSPAQLNAKMTLEAEKLLQQLTTLYADAVTPTSFVLEGRAEQEILAMMQDLKPDVLVIGTHGRKPWQELLLGSVSEDIIRHSTCPVMLIRDNEG